ncbi:nucleotide sugar dehydrogenase [Sphingomonas gilva]|uniref:Nucleotide sugar dehydrogenase n=1 Tax=Sphingomonas gilva TaxID=2305907 RepID=A0A396RK78_9SPHN|nr:nucleotide sugar dehydrogenase [Sphingomonas gilva]RHW16647.1 nucleotide sugar dehydrogenase [Sphingomonas gilva]
MIENNTIVVVGLGYVGLPLAIALADRFTVWGLDVDAERIAELQRHHDRTHEVSADRLAGTKLSLTQDPAACPPADIYIVTVPTPVDAENKPDLSIVLAATRTVAAMLDGARKPIVVYESTVYPGVTEELCGPELERVSGLACGADFFLGYSPERINPGDREHTVDRITKVVAGQTEAVAARLADVYGAITSGGTFTAKSIKAAEAAKVIENAQRDINIAFMNEIATIFAKLDVSVWDVLSAANTKWNFLPFRPGLVGGHCIGVDPYYLAYRAEVLGREPRVILAGRSTNDDMAAWVAGEIDRAAGGERPRTLVLGLTFKENVPDLRNSKVADLVAALQTRGHDVTVVDPLANAAEANHEYGIAISSEPPADRRFNIVILAVPHTQYCAMDEQAIRALLTEGGLFADIPGAIAPRLSDQTIRTWTL